MQKEPTDPETLDLSNSPEKRISGDTFCKFFDHHEEFDDFTIIDCRTQREYDGGHIKGAIRCHPYEIENNIANLYNQIWKPRSLYIFHCEYSAFRGPTAYYDFAEAHSQSANRDEPLHIFVLDGGYRQFYADHPDYCEGGYVPEMSMLFR